MKDNRIDFIDYMKGIGILLVMLQHSIGDIYQPLERFILSFHMPLFFFVGGILWGYRERCDENLLRFMAKRAYSFIFPIIIMGTLGLISELGVTWFNKRQVTIDILESYIQWFLPTYFVMDVVLFLIKKHVRMLRYELLICLAAFVLSFVVGDVFLLKQSLCACVFGIIGKICGETWLKHRNEADSARNGGGGIGYSVCPVLLW